VLGAPELDTGLQVGSHQSGAEGQNPFPHPAGHAAFDAAQGTVGFLGYERMLAAHVQLFIHQYPQVLLDRAALIHLCESLNFGEVKWYEIYRKQKKNCQNCTGQPGSDQEFLYQVSLKEVGLK